MNPRRLALGDELRLLRESAGLSGKRLAEQLGWPASKVSRIERARQAVTDSDLVAVAAALTLDSVQLAQLRDELRAIRLEEARWSRQLRAGHRPVQDVVAVAERDARRIRGFSITLVPGLLQTAEYARHVFTSLAEMHESPRDTEDAVRARMERQQVLYDETKTIELLMTEAALWFPAAPSSVMLAQIDRLITLQGLPALRLGIIPLGAQLPAGITHNFVMKDDVVTIELITTELATRAPEDVQLFERYLDRLWSVAAEGDDARAILTRAARQVADAADHSTR
ncbi:helix-turn-helix domain-containing protein [Prauserella shujinwangii]|uniref:helix-turn-helix domain-containing protein n=1 Tax=Prauserella shujinwangii TaxID=1453103 RepID=UPI001FE9FC90|nr:helix-turn-helix transcriptional regulator [Prauserella shujinwangii]